MKELFFKCFLKRKSRVALSLMSSTVSIFLEYTNARNRADTLATINNFSHLGDFHTINYSGNYEDILDYLDNLYVYPNPVGATTNITYSLSKRVNNDKITLITYSKIDKAQEICNGENIKVAIIDWQFDLNGKAAKKYIYPVSKVPGEEIGALKSWHYEWMAGVILTPLRLLKE